MFSQVDLYLGTFLIICGFILCLLNLRRIVKNRTYSSVLLSENIVLMCVGLAFILRTVHGLNPLTKNMEEIEGRIAEETLTEQSSMTCNFYSLLMSYGPLVVSLANSFVTLIIDNYMHYRMLQDAKEKTDENIVQEIDHNPGSQRNIDAKSIVSFLKPYFSYIAILLQWAVPLILALSMYPMEVSEMTFRKPHPIGNRDFCPAIHMSNKLQCKNIIENTNVTEIHKPTQLPIKHLDAYENDYFRSNTNLTDTVLSNVYNILSSLKNHSVTNNNITSTGLRKVKVIDVCMKICYVDTKMLLLYMFIVAIISFFIPITISTVLITKIHTMDVKTSNTKIYVTRELLYNILFWTPVMFDTFVSLILCAYEMNGTRTSIFHVAANIYQAVKNFMNTNYFMDNAVSPK